MALRLRSEVAATETEYGMVLLDTKGGSYWLLNPTGAVIVGLLQEGTHPEQAAQILAERFGIAEDNASGDIEEFLEKLRAAGLAE